MERCIFVEYPQNNQIGEEQFLRRKVEKLHKIVREVTCKEWKDERFAFGSIPTKTSAWKESMFQL